MTRAVGALLLALLASCAQAVGPPAEPSAPAEALVWPKAPQQPRIKFLYAFRDPKDLGLDRSLFERLWDFIAGEESREMIRPYAIAAADDAIAVADPGTRSVHLYNLRAETYRRIVKAGDELLESPVGVALGPGRIYVADSALGKVFAFDPGGDLAFTLEGIQRPTGLAYDAGTRRLYVADTLAHRISVFDDAGTALFSFGRRGTDRREFNYPTHLSAWADKLYVNDTMNFRLQAFDLDGAYRGSFGSHGDGSGDMAQPKGVAVDGAGHIYVADALFNRIQIFDSDGMFLLAFGGEGAKVGQFWLPSGLFIAGDRIYVADSYNRRVQVFQFLAGG